MAESLDPGHQMNRTNNLWNTTMNVSISIEEFDEYLSKAQLQKITLVLIMIILLFCLLGSIGNMLSMVVLSNQRMRNQTNCILAALCISDTLFLLHSFAFITLQVYQKMNPGNGGALRAHIYPYVGAYGSVVTARITSCLTVLLCAERFIAVFFPMQARTICSKRNTGIAIGSSYIITLVVFIPFLLKYEAVDNYVNENYTFVTTNTTAFYNNNVKFFSVYGTFVNIVFRFAPLVILPILNVLMIRAVHKTWQKRRIMSTAQESPNTLRLSSRNGKHCSSSEQNHITIMLLIVSFVFLICILPGALNSLATHVWPTYNSMGKYKNLYKCISTVTFLLETINSSVNFIIYMLLSRKFRIFYKEIFCCGHGQYYNKLSISSMREKFKWSSNRRRDRSPQTNPCVRQTVSDIGPMRNGFDKWCKNNKQEIHSDGFRVESESSSSHESRGIINNTEGEMNLHECFCARRLNRPNYKNSLN